MNHDEDLIMKIVGRLSSVETLLKEVKHTVNNQNNYLLEIQKSVVEESKEYMINMHACQNNMARELDRVYETMAKERKRINELLMKYFFMIVGSVVLVIAVAIFLGRFGA
jgi:TRAP-type mannitol/chloroaromatic compound transport system permease small subunit